MDSILKQLAMNWVPHNGGFILRVRDKCGSAYVGEKGFTNNINNATVVGSSLAPDTLGNIFDSPLDFTFDV